MPPRRVDAPERMDQPGLDTAMLEQSLHHVAEVNRWLGGTRALIRAIRPWLEAGACSVLDVGTGSGDVPRALHRFARRTGHRIEVAAIEPHPQTAAIARNELADLPIRVLRGDARALPFEDRSFDIVLFSLTLHHLAQDHAIAALRELARVARAAVIVSELERCWPNYLGARFLAATRWRGNPITRHDGPLSVLRAFTPAELRDLGHAAGLPTARVDRRFFYRLVLVAPTTSRVW